MNYFGLENFELKKTLNYKDDELCIKNLELLLVFNLKFCHKIYKKK
jgi:hypothetical protein